MKTSTSQGRQKKQVYPQGGLAGVISALGGEEVPRHFPRVRIRGPACIWVRRGALINEKYVPISVGGLSS